MLFRLLLPCLMGLVRPCSPGRLYTVEHLQHLAHLTVALHIAQCLRRCQRCHGASHQPQILRVCAV